MHNLLQGSLPALGAVVKESPPVRLHAGNVAYVVCDAPCVLEIAHITEHELAFRQLLFLCLLGRKTVPTPEPNDANDDEPGGQNEPDIERPLVQHCAVSVALAKHIGNIMFNPGVSQCRFNCVFGKHSY
jgi:hypothetical protein